MSSPSNPCNPESAWSVVFNGYDPKNEGRREALCALGNGYFVTRAAAPEATADAIHYPGTYRAGLYNRLVSSVEGKAVDDESLVNLPNWLSLTFCIDQGDWFSLDEVEILAYRQVLHLRHGFLRREVKFRDRQGRETVLHETRFVSMAQPHLAGLCIELTAENWAGKLEIRSALDGRVINNNVERYAAYSKQHLEPLEIGASEPEGIWLKMRTCQSEIEVALTARTRVFVNYHEASLERTLDCKAAQAVERIYLHIGSGATIAIEKIVALYTSRDLAIAQSAEAARQAIRQASNFNSLFDVHKRAWERLWLRCDLDIEPIEYLLALRLHIFHLLQTISPHTIDLDAGIPARGWHGEDYRGHIFWDETFVLPFLSYRFPAIARSMLLYRYRRLDAARRLAREYSYRGAMFPWRSASSGREETPRFQLNPLSGRWLPDNTCLQHHISAIVAYDLWQYYTITNDVAFLCDYGAELLIEIARFWVSIASYNPELDRYEIRDVVGPDEYHTAYPNAATPGIDNNTYTNLMVVWTLCRAQEVLDLLPPSRRAELWQMLELSQDEIDHWDIVSQKMRVIFHDDGILSQYEGFARLQKFDLQQFCQQHDDRRIDWALEAEGDNVNRYQVAKQADVAVLFFLLSETELTALLQRLGYQFDRQLMEQTIAYYLERTAHQSSLSRLVYAGALTTFDSDASWQLFTRACFTDLSNEGSESTNLGLHLGVMAGTLHVLHHHYLGLRVHNDSVCLNPSLPSCLKRLHISLRHRHNDLQVEVRGNSLSVTAAPTNRESVKVICRGQAAELEPGTSIITD